MSKEKRSALMTWIDGYTAGHGAALGMSKREIFDAYALIVAVPADCDDEANYRKGYERAVREERVRRATQYPALFAPAQN